MVSWHQHLQQSQTHTVRGFGVLLITFTEQRGSHLAVIYSEHHQLHTGHRTEFFYHEPMQCKAPCRGLPGYGYEYLTVKIILKLDSAKQDATRRISLQRQAGSMAKMWEKHSPLVLSLIGCVGRRNAQVPPWFPLILNTISNKPS